MPTAALRRFHPATARWFRARFGAPTAVQAAAWPAIADGAHVLATAPTGSGKTLAAFLWAIDQLATGVWPTEGLSLVYISPLKALGTDVRRNLLEPLAEVQTALAAAGLPPIAVTAQVRSGDTPQSERRKMLLKPPQILITTPESLNLLLLAESGRRVLATVRCVVLDEIHAVAATKRGTWLMAAVERLDRLVTQNHGHLQRIALSATVRPLDVIAALVGGREPGPDGQWQPRVVRVLQPAAHKVIDVAVLDPCADPQAVATPEESGELGLGPGDLAYWPTLVRAFKERMARNRSTLFFANSRRMAEKLARMLNEGEPEPLAWAHHGSLSRELRQDVEARLKAGELRALCATSSLELGIDIGELDEVVLLQAPRSLSACIQRIGRAGHQVGAVSRGLLVPMHGRDTLSCVVLAPLISLGRGEALQPVRAPLDVLAQVLLAMCAVEPWQPDDLYVFVQRCEAWATLTRPAFDRTLAMLTGRYADSRLRELVPRLRPTETGALEAKPGVRLLLARSGGVIPDRGYFSIRVQQVPGKARPAGSDKKGAKIGELDEEFVWERHLGDEFTIGAQSWRIARITHDDVEVVPGGRPGAMTPFWRAEAEARTWAFSEAIADFLQAVEPRLDDPDLAAELGHSHRTERHTAQRLVDWLRRQREATKALPHRHRVIVEYTVDPGTSSDDREQVAVHAPWGGKLLRPWALALAAALEAKGEPNWHITATDDCLGLRPPPGADVQGLLLAVTAANCQALVEQHLGRSGFFGARFREAAALALLLPRHKMGRRMPLWQTRARAKELLQLVEPYGDFPIVAEAWRTCLEDAFELRELGERLTELQDGTIALTEVRTSAPSPMAEGLVWANMNTAMYADDEPDAAGLPLHEQVLREVARRPDLRPRIGQTVVTELEARLQRTLPGYAPRDAAGLLDAVRERVLLAEADLTALLAAMARDHDLQPADILASLGERLVRLQRPGATLGAVVARDALADLARDGDPLILRAFLQQHGPLPLARLQALWGWDDAGVQRRVAALVAAGHAVLDELTEGASVAEVCDTGNLQRLLRMQRAAQRPGLRPLPLGHLPLFLAQWQGLTPRGEGPDAVRKALEQLSGLPASATAWETTILPARVWPYQPAWLDSLLQNSDLQWFGAGVRQIAFAPRAALALYTEVPDPDETTRALLPDVDARYDLQTLQARSGLPSTELAERMWALAWQGRLAADGMAALRQAALTDFAVPRVEPRQERRLARGLGSGKLWPGTWGRLATAPAQGPVDEAERDKERVRQLLDRHGVLFRELLAHEPPLLAWGRLLPAMRMLELAGELVAGQFFEELPGLQFAGPEAVRLLRTGLDQGALYAMSAQDPASPCGLALPWRGLTEDGALPLPSRLASTQLFWHGARLVAVARRGGKHLDFALGPDDPLLPRVLALLAEAVQRAVAPERALTVEQIGDQFAASSPYRAALLAVGFAPDFRSLVLRRSY